MTQQAAITQLTSPAGPKNDAAFVSCTTAPKSLVFAPGTVFPNGGPVQQNKFTTGNASGLDGLTLLQEILAGNGLSPAIPLPSSLVEFDASLVADSYALTANVDFGAECSFVGLTNQANGVQPTLDTSGFTISPFVSLTNTNLMVSTATAVTAPFRSLTLTDCTLQSDGNLYATLPNAGACVIEANNAIIGDAADPVLSAPAGCNLTLNCYGQTQLTVGALVVDPAAVVVINAWPGSAIDSSYVGMAGVFIFTPTFALPFVAGSGSNAVGKGTCIGLASHAQGANSQVIGNNCIASGASSRAAGLDCHANYAGSDAFSAKLLAVRGDNQVEWLQARGTTPGIGVGESVELLIAGTDVLTLVTPSGIAGFTIEMQVIASGMIGGVSQVQSFIQNFSCINSAGLPSIRGFTAQQQFGDAGANTWTFAVAFSAVGSNHLAMTFTTGATTSAVKVMASIKLVNISG